jgi:uncharacterized metal-binding protein
MSNCQNNSNGNFALSVSKTNGKCPIGEKVGQKCIENNMIPVISCEGACIRGEISRLAANYVSKEENYRRGCHGELFTVPDSKIANWIETAQKVVCIDGCFLKCHSRILENMIEPSKLLVFDALSHYKKYNDIFDIDEVPEEERKEAGMSVSKWVIQSIKENNVPDNSDSCSN